MYFWAHCLSDKELTCLNVDKIIFCFLIEWYHTNDKVTADHARIDRPSHHR